MYTFIIWIKYDKGNYKTFTKVCKKPTYTRIYKECKKQFNNYEYKVHSFGYCIASQFNYKSLID